MFSTCCINKEGASLQSDLIVTIQPNLTDGSHCLSSSGRASHLGNILRAGLSAERGDSQPRGPAPWTFSVEMKRTLVNSLAVS